MRVVRWGLLLSAAVGIGATIWWMLQETPPAKGPRHSMRNTPPEPPTNPAIEPETGRVAVAAPVQEIEPSRMPLPWDAEVLEQHPKDAWGYPTRQRPFMHKVLNQSADGFLQGIENGRLHYGWTLEDILSHLPARYREEAGRVMPALEELHRPALQTIAEMEMELWRTRWRQYHEAVERGDYLAVDNTNFATEKEKAENNERSLETMQLGVLDRDYFDIACSTLSNDHRRGAYNGIIYLRRSVFPESFALLEQIRALNQQAEQMIRDRLGVPR